MRRLVILLFAVLAIATLDAQTLRMTTVHIDEQKELRPRNNHIIGGIGFTSFKEEGERIPDNILMLGYYKTDILMDNKIGLYINLTLAIHQGPGVTLGATYKYLEEGDHNLYFIGGLGLARYLREKKYIYRYSYGDEERYRRNSGAHVRIEGGMLYNYKRFDIRATVGAPDYFTLGIGYKFGFNF